MKPTLLTKLLFGAVLLIIAFVAYTSFNSSEDSFVQNRETNLAAKPKITPTKENPTSWDQNYRTSFIFNKQIVKVQSVNISNLDKKTATVVYNLNIIPKVSSNWIKNKKNYTLAKNNTKERPYKLTSESLGSSYRIKLYYKFATTRLISGSYLGILIPNYQKRGNNIISYKPKAVRLGLEVPKNFQDIEERRGSI